MINENKIQSLISENYNIFITQVDKIRDGSADLFIIDKKFVLKMYQKNFDLKRILKSIDICDYLYNLGYNVPKYYKTLINKYYFIYNGCYGVLMSFLSGTKLNAFAADINQIFDSAKFYAKLECDLQNYKKLLPEYDFCKYGTENISETLSKINILISKTNDESIVNDLKTRIKFLNELDIEFFSDISKITICNCHGDYYVSQCLYNRRKIKSILDFESAKKMPIIIEIIRSYIYLDYNFDINNFILYVKEINKIFTMILNICHIYII